MDGYWVWIVISTGYEIESISRGSFRYIMVFLNHKLCYSIFNLQPLQMSITTPLAGEQVTSMLQPLRHFACEEFSRQ
jgi:hypothetical protein